MGTGGGRVVLDGGGRRRRKLEEEEDDEYVADDDEEDDEEEEYQQSAATAEEEEEEEGGDDEAEPEDESDADFVGDEEEEEELDDLEDEDDLEVEAPRPKRPLPRPRPPKVLRKGKPQGSRRRRLEEDDDDYEEGEEEDADFDPDVDEEEEEEEVEEEEDDEEEEYEEDDDDSDDFAPIRARKTSTKNHVAKRKPAAGRKKKKRKGSRVSKAKKPKKAVSGRPRRKKRWATDDEEEEEEDDADFIVEDDQEEEEENHRPKKKAKAARKPRDVMPEPDVEPSAWPAVESDTSDFEFVTSDEEAGEKEAPAPEPAKIKAKKGRKRWGSGSESSSDSDYVISEQELKDLEVSMPQESALQSPITPPRRTFLTRRMGEKGKEPEEAWKQTCGICLSEEQRATIQGVLNCCSHYFCFACIMEWSKVESRCPLCKRRFTTITKSSMADLGLGSRKAVIRVEKRDQVYQPTEEEMRRWLDPYENVVCIECNCGGDDNLMLLCDICDSSAHTYCVGLGRQVPEGNWYCGGCRSGGEGPSSVQTQDRVAHCRESNTNPANSTSGSFGSATPSGVFQRPPPISTQPSPQGFDLNLSPRETPDEDKREESHVSADAASTPTGRHATLDRRRAFNRRIRILLFRPRGATNGWQNPIQLDRTIPESEQNVQSTCTPTEVNPSCSRDNSMQNQQSSSSFVQPARGLIERTYGGGSDFQQTEGAKEQLIPIVKRNIKLIYAQSPLDQSDFKNVARRATHTILALFGIAHNEDFVVTTPHPLPSHCNHACDGQEPTFLMRTCCSSCFNSFVGGVVSYIAKMLT
uniref:PHD-type domain-containing protein n=1 Tax=Leersia perrieri TaxID=77586 RepID=A0A0D9X370_9ORYZ